MVDTVAEKNRKPGGDGNVTGIVIWRAVSRSMRSGGWAANSYINPAMIRGEARGRMRCHLMAYRDEVIIYMLTRADVRDVAKRIGLVNLTEEHYRMAEKYIESSFSEGTYTWTDAVIDALRDAEAERRKKK